MGSVTRGRTASRSMTGAEVLLVRGGEIDVATAPPFLDTLSGAMGRRPPRVDLDLAAVTFMDARTVGAVGRAALSMGDWDGTLRARNARYAVRRAFDLCGWGALLAPASTVIPPGAGGGRERPRGSQSDGVGPASSDHRLAQLVGRGSRSAFDLLYLRHSGGVRAVGASILRSADAAEDLSQEVFIELWRNAGRYAPERGAFRPWLLAIAHHRAVDTVRRHVKQSRIDEAIRGAAHLAAPEREPLGEAIANDEGARLRRGLVGLPAAEREAVVLAYGGGLSHTEVARLIGAPIGTVKSRIRKGKSRLALALEPVVPAAA